MDDFGLLDVIWTVIVIYALLFLLMTLFSIVVDLFRDHELSGWFKAGWLILLLVLPIVGALIYLIARGKGMARRSQKNADEAKAEFDGYVRNVAASAGPAQEIAAAKALLDAGTISAEEFAQLKSRALS